MIAKLTLPNLPVGVLILGATTLPVRVSPIAVLTVELFPRLQALGNIAFGLAGRRADVGGVLRVGRAVAGDFPLIWFLYLFIVNR